jgi:hypothetical protein
MAWGETHHYHQHGEVLHDEQPQEGNKNRQQHAADDDDVPRALDITKVPVITAGGNVVSKALPMQGWNVGTLTMTRDWWTWHQTGSFDGRASLGFPWCPTRARAHTQSHTRSNHR